MNQRKGQESMKRFMVSVSNDIEADANEAKKDLFFNTSYAEMYRQLIRLGLDALKTENGHVDVPSAYPARSECAQNRKWPCH